MTVISLPTKVKQKNQLIAQSLKPVERRLAELELDNAVLQDCVGDLAEEVTELKSVIQKLLGLLKHHG